MTNSSIILSDLRDALDAYPTETPKQTDIIMAAARGYEPLVQTLMEFAISTGERINNLLNRWIDHQ